MYYTIYTFQLAIGINIARTNTPNNGPDVAEKANIDDSMTPDNNPTQNAIPIITIPAIPATTLITPNCCLSFSPLKCGN